MSEPVSPGKGLPQAPGGPSRQRNGLFLNKCVRCGRAVEMEEAQNTMTRCNDLRCDQAAFEKYYIDYHSRVGVCVRRWGCGVIRPADLRSA